MDVKRKLNYAQAAGYKSNKTNFTNPSNYISEILRYYACPSERQSSYELQKRELAELRSQNQQQAAEITQSTIKLCEDQKSTIEKLQEMVSTETSNKTYLSDILDLCEKDRRKLEQENKHLKEQLAALQTSQDYKSRYIQLTQCFAASVNQKLKLEQQLASISHRTKSIENSQNEQIIATLIETNEQLQSKISDLENRHKCCVCLSEPARILLMPCKHLCACQPCSNQITICPLCQSEITDRILTFGT